MKKNKIIAISAILLPVSILVFFVLFNKQLNLLNGFTFNKTSHTTTINWIGHWAGEGLRQQMVSEAANEFEFMNQHIKVNLQFPESVYFEGQILRLGNNDDAEIAFIAEQVTAEKAEWDILRIKDHYPRVAQRLNDPNWGKKYLVDFSEIPEFVNSHYDFVFSKEYKDANGGITIGPYNEGFYYAIWFNKELAKKIGVEIKQYGMTPDDLIGYIKAVNDYNKANGTSIIPMFEENSWVIAPMIIYTLFFSQVGDYNKLIDVSFDPAKLTYLEKALEVFEKMAQYEPLPKNRSEIVWAKTFDYLLNEKCLLYAQGSWMYTIWNSIDREKLANIVPAELPSFNSNSPAYIGGYKACWAVPKNAPNKEAAIKLMLYWASQDMAEKWVRYTKCPTAVQGSLTSTTLGFDQFEDFQHYISEKYGLHMLNPVDHGFILGAKNKDINIPVMDILEKKQTAAEVMRGIRRQLK